MPRWPEVTPTQRAWLRAIGNHAAVHKRPPTIRELVDAFELSSTNGAAEMIDRLKSKGLVTAEPRIARSIALTDLGQAVLR
jgi:SOS-response transcriptional repressor LexA